MKILIAEDDFTSRQILSGLLIKWGYETIVVENGKDALKTLKSPDAPPLAVLDWIMPEMDGIEVVQKIRGMGKKALPYIIMLTSRDEKIKIAEALNSGSNDYICKPYDNEELRARINVGRRVVQLQTDLIKRLGQLSRANDTINKLARTDELTGLANRRRFNEKLEEEVYSSRRHGFPLSIIMADIDWFKQVNDEYGHETGDRVLKVFADTMNKITRSEDSPARWGGEEFIVLLPHCSADEAFTVAERMRTGFEEARVEGVKSSLSSSFGIAELKSNETRDRFISRADEALYRAKQEGRNRVVK